MLPQNPRNLIFYSIACCLVGWGCRIHRLHRCRGVRPFPTRVLDMTLNNLMLRFQLCGRFGGIKSTPSLPSLPGPLRPGVVAPHRALYMGQIELKCVLMLT